MGGGEKFGAYLCPHGGIAYKQQWTRLSCIFFRLTPLSSRKYWRNWSSIYSVQTFQLSSQLIASPNPGVSITLRRNRTPFSSISNVFFSILVVFSILSSTSGIFRSLYKSARNRLFISVDLPGNQGEITLESEVVQARKNYFTNLIHSLQPPSVWIRNLFSPIFDVLVLAVWTVIQCNHVLDLK